MTIDREFPVCAAIQMDDGYVIRGHRHSDCLHTMARHPKYSTARATQDSQGFMTSRNRFVGREEACRLFRLAGMRSARTFTVLHHDAKELFSEDLY